MDLVSRILYVGKNVQEGILSDVYCTVGRLSRKQVVCIGVRGFVKDKDSSCDKLAVDRILIKALKSSPLMDLKSLQASYFQ